MLQWEDVGGLVNNLENQQQVFLDDNLQRHRLLWRRGQPASSFLCLTHNQAVDNTVSAIKEVRRQMSDLGSDIILGFEIL